MQSKRKKISIFRKFPGIFIVCVCILSIYTIRSVLTFFNFSLNTFSTLQPEEMKVCDLTTNNCEMVNSKVFTSYKAGLCVAQPKDNHYNNVIFSSLLKYRCYPSFLIIGTQFII